MERFFGDFSDVDSVISAFEIAPSELEDCEIIAAWYEYADYEGSAGVVFRKGGKLFETYGGHCSCSGLEGSWSPEPVVESELLQRALRGAQVGSPPEREFWQRVQEVLSA